MIVIHCPLTLINFLWYVAKNPSKKDPQTNRAGVRSSSKTFLNSSLTKFFKSIALPAAGAVGAVLLPPAPWGAAVGAVRRGRGGRAAGTGAEASGGGP